MRRDEGHHLSGLPELQAGQHLDPTHGGCFMEYASLLAGEKWSDHPRCTHPALAQLARLVNDAASQRDRQQLARLIPDVIGVTGRDARLTPALVLLCIDALPPRQRARMSTHLQGRWARRRWTAAARGGFGGVSCRITEGVYRSGPAARVMAEVVAALSDPRAAEPAQLRTLLCDAIALSRQLLAITPSDSARTGDLRGMDDRQASRHL